MALAVANRCNILSSRVTCILLCPNENSADDLTRGPFCKLKKSEIRSVFHINFTEKITDINNMLESRRKPYGVSEHV